MHLQDVTKAEKSDFRRDLQKNTAKSKYFVGRRVARGAGFCLPIESELRWRC